ncbi:Dfp1/Him1, central region-domain-containing protein [Astrocystis sublimbata]|nr:Dfp1/Him1, central region-domain-containing protein [Astrocystis sublimbata]
MATISLSPTPVEFLAMSNRRVPLASNQNVANSPLRTAGLKQKRTLAQLQREEPYGQQPPAKKLVIDASTQRVVKSPSQQPRAPKSHIPVQSRRALGSHTVDTKLAREKAAARQQQQQQQEAAAKAEYEYTETDIEEIQAWKEHHRSRFSKNLFYFDQISSEVARSLKRHIASLGGSETAFFSADVTHVITSRTIPAEIVSRENGRDVASDKDAAQQEQEQAATINPSLLTRDPSTSVKARLFDADLRSRAQRAAPPSMDQALRVPKKAVDILVRARDMKKKIWTSDKLFRFTALLLEKDPYRSADMAYGRLRNTTSATTESRGAEDRNLLRLLQKERANGPSDRDAGAVEYTFFRGPYLHVYDIDEKQKPIMAKEYPKATDKSKGIWPQFQTAALGRCPFIEDSEVREAREAKEARDAREAQQKSRAKAESQENVGAVKPAPQRPRMAPPRPVTGKRTLGEMELGHNRQSSVASAEFPSLARGAGGENMDFSRKAFTSHAATGRLLAGEPVASGMQPSNVTSAIRSQMISSTANTPGGITGLSKEVHGLQRQVLKFHQSGKSQDPSSRRTAESSFRDENTVRRPSTLSRASSRKVEVAEDSAEDKGASETVRSSKRAAPRKKHDRDLKPGYCENCTAKYADFDEHIESSVHRKFANNDENWVELDDLLAQLERMPKRQSWKPSHAWSHSTQHELF